MSDQHTSVRRQALADAAALLRLTADDFEGMAARWREQVSKEELTGRKQHANFMVRCMSEKAQLLRGQAQQIERL